LNFFFVTPLRARGSPSGAEAPLSEPEAGAEPEPAATPTLPPAYRQAGIEGGGKVVRSYFLGCIKLRSGDFKKTFAWGTADRALIRCCLFNRIAANRADIIIHDFIFPNIFQSF